MKKEITLDNEFSPAPMLQSVNAAMPERIYSLSNQAVGGTLSNDSLFVESFFQEPLTIYAVGYKDPYIDDALEAILPAVPATPRFEYAFFKNPQEFLIDVDDVRAVNEEFKQVKYESTKLLGKTLNKGLAMVIDLDAVSTEPAWAEKRVAKLLRRLKRSELLRGINILLTAAGSASNKTWDSSADPDADVLSAVTNYGDTLGFNVNRVLYDVGAWTKRFTSLRGNANAAKFATAGLTEAQLAPVVGVDEIIVLKQRYQSTATAKARMATNKVIGFYAEQQPGLEDPSVVKRFTSPTMSGGPFRVYQQQLSAKRVLLSVEHYSNVLPTSSIGAFALNIS
jgi:hypothetical protein